MNYWVSLFHYFIALISLRELGEYWGGVQIYRENWITERSEALENLRVSYGCPIIYFIPKI